MIEKLHLRCSTERVYKLFVQSYSKLNKKWVIWVRDIAAAIEGDLNDPEFQEFLSYLRSKKCTYTSAEIIRKYTKKELYSAELLSFWTSSQLDFTAEEADCEFDTPCEMCEGGRTPKDKNLIMNLSQISKDKDIADTISNNELMFSERLADLVKHHNIKGVELYPVQHWKKAAPAKKWFYVKINSVINISARTVFGDAFEGEELSIHQVPKSSCGHSVIHTQTRSEYFLKRDSWDKADIIRSDWIFGTHPKGSVGYPSPQMYISQKFYAILREHNIKGYTVDIAHLV